MSLGQIDVWICRLAKLPAGSLEVLSQSERERAAKFAVRRPAKAFIQRRTIIRNLLSEHLGIPATEIEIEESQSGKPSIINPNVETALGFSIANSTDILIVALARGMETGVDVEVLHPPSDIQNLALRYFTDREVKHVQSLPESCATIGFLKLWTRKEAIMKAHGDGMKLGLGNIDVSEISDQTPVEIYGRSYFVKDLYAPAGYIAALASDHAIPDIHYHSLG